MYRKPTATNVTIHGSSFHPKRHIMAANSSMTERLINVPLSKDNYKKEIEIINYIADCDFVNSISKTKTQKKKS